MTSNTTVHAARTITFSENFRGFLDAAVAATGADLADVSFEVGLYDRGAWRAPMIEWDKIRAWLSAERETLRGAERSGVTRALGRIPTA